MRVLKNPSNKFWNWYERHYRFNIIFASILFSWQLVHLYWLTSSVVAPELLGRSFFNPSRFWEVLIIFVDYTEIPAIITSTILYLHEYRTGARPKLISLLYLFFINSQWLHLFWITDEFVIDVFNSPSNALKILAYIAISLDYLELPVIFDTGRRAFREIASKFV